MTTRFLSIAFLLMTSLLFAADPAVRDAGSKIRGDYLPGSQARSYQRSARDHAQWLYYQSQSPQPIPKEMAEEHVGAVRKNLSGSKKALAKVQAAHSKDEDVKKRIASIEEHHAKALELCGMVETECAKQKGDMAHVENCCSEMWHELDAAHAKTEELLKKLKIEPLAPPKKPSPKAGAGGQQK